VYTLNESVAITRARDKLRALQLLARKRVGLPRTAFAHAPDDTEGVMQLVGGAPMVIKLIEGTQGQGVVLAETNNAASSVIDAFRGLDAYFLVQEFVSEAKGSDIRCFVVGDEVVAAMQRTASAGEFRSNLHRGGSASLVEITAAERRTALQASICCARTPAPWSWKLTRRRAWKASRPLPESTLPHRSSASSKTMPAPTAQAPRARGERLRSRSATGTLRRRERPARDGRPGSIERRKRGSPAAKALDVQSIERAVALVKGAS
jgi:hypothetical protein